MHLLVTKKTVFQSISNVLNYNTKLLIYFFVIFLKAPVIESSGHTAYGSLEIFDMAMVYCLLRSQSKSLL